MAICVLSCLGPDLGTYAHVTCQAAPQGTDSPLLSDSFTRQVLQRLQAAVGPGEVVSYQKLAALAGNPQAARAVGRAMRYNPVSQGMVQFGVQAKAGVSVSPEPDGCRGLCLWPPVTVMRPLTLLYPKA